MIHYPLSEQLKRGCSVSLYFKHIYKVLILGFLTQGVRSSGVVKLISQSNCIKISYS